MQNFLKDDSVTEEPTQIEQQAQQENEHPYLNLPFAPTPSIPH